MTCIVAPSASNGWSAGDSMNLSTMSADTPDAAHTYQPRKTVQRSSSSSSMASTGSSTSTISATPNQPNGIVNGDGRYVNPKPQQKYNPKALVRALLPASQKAEAVAGLSDTRPQSIPITGPQSAPSSISALHNGSQTQQAPPMQNQAQANGMNRAPHPSEQGMSILLQLQPMNGTFERKSISIPVAPDIVRIGRQTNQKTLPTRGNGFFDSKVLSRQHAEIWSDDRGKVWIRDVKSSNGTFVNGKRLSQENRDSEPHPLAQGDILELGIDIVSEDQKTVVHHKVAARVEHAGPHAPAPPNPGIDYGDLDPSQMNGAMNQANRGRPQNQVHQQPNGRFNGPGAPVSNVSTAPYQAKWLQPVSMEQIVKRLNTELKQARHQASTINANHSIVKAMKPQQKPSPPSSLHKSILLPNKSTDSFKARMASAPPAPPPSQPLPEAPTDAMVRSKLHEQKTIPPMLRRSDTEKPKGSPLSASFSPIKPDSNSHILSLVDQLSSARSEIAMQSQKLKDLEAILMNERESRRSAEERATRLETAEISTWLASPEQARLPEAHGKDAEQSKQLDTDLQQRADLMRIELDEMKVLMSQYRSRAETAEADSRRDRQTLADMVNSLEQQRRAEVELLEAQTGSATADEESERKRTLQQHGKAFSDAFDRAKYHLYPEKYLEDEVPVSIMQNGHAKAFMDLPALEKLGGDVLAAALDRSKQTSGQRAERDSAHHTLAQSTRHGQLVQTAPYASMMGVVILGLGIMAYLNGWQKVTDP